MKRLVDCSNTCLARLALFGIAASVLLSGCATRLRIQTSYVPPGSLRLAQVVRSGTEKEIKSASAQPLQDILRNCGVQDTEIRDGSVVLARIYCCGGPNEKGTAIVMYVPPEIELHAGDVVELRAADTSKKGELGQINVVTRIRQAAAEQNGGCRWDPPDERLWCRTLYAYWMVQEGWKLQHGLYKAWYKPAP